MPNPSWVPWGNSRPCGRGGCGSGVSGVVAAGGAEEVLEVGQSGSVGVGPVVGGQFRVSWWVGGSGVSGGSVAWSSGMSSGWMMRTISAVMWVGS